MKQALISPTEKVYSYGGQLLGERVAEVTTTTFEVAPPLFWVACNDDVQADQWYYDTTSYLIVAIPLAPAITASFTPNPATIGQTTVLSWDVTNATGVKLSSYGDQIFPVSGSQNYNYANTGTYTETITAISSQGNISRPVKVGVA
ncbi:hypothetical protein UFOVP937_10 [uncultured Caudovirales phage]|uniref:PKD domain containing protein n=1 Tax=uncultured Caudovirales phage TaxID=2100421 RepID=A0A6J5PTB6_9CAUD|nr:hypothetical protein UFOVP937_10 [uncultured Caudovirales phage]CAB4214328.1 hypothetical protein UFOVP1465_35 [uncultured Caudovirales phage]